MKSFGSAFFAFIGLILPAAAQDLSLRAWQLESRGDASAAHELLERGAQSDSATVADVRAYAEFLDRHQAPETRQAYERLLRAATPAQKAPVARRLAILDLLAGDQEAARKHLEVYQAAGGHDLSLLAVNNSTEKKPTVSI